MEHNETCNLYFTGVPEGEEMREGNKEGRDNRKRRKRGGKGGGGGGGRRKRMWVEGGKGRKNMPENLFVEIMAANFPNLGKQMQT